MRFYAEHPLRLTGQVLVDLAAIAWIYLTYRLVTGTQAAVLELRSPGHRMIAAGGQLGGTFTDAARTAAEVPLVGDRLAGALGRGTAAGEVLIDSGHHLLSIVELSASALAVAVAVLALIPLLAVWLPRRIRYARAASRVTAMREHAVDVLALHALTELPYRKLKTASADPAADWRAGDAGVITRLAGLRLAALGLRAPRVS